ncbi:hypothetical protein M758_3G062300 [Ceratodon purpureus]|nr:hypothetical protein M758_3G062300 [Ceratodon purpureus]
METVASQMLPPDHHEYSKVAVRVECEMGSVQKDPRAPDHLSRAIFVSYSETETEFVERLCKDMEQAELSPSFGNFSDREELARRVEAAAEECELAIVVVSEEYFTRSEWSMVELAALVEKHGCKILLLFFGLSCEEFRDSQRRGRWFQVWDSWRDQSDGGVCMDVWKDALRILDGRDGVEYVKALGEAHYRKEIVTYLCRRVLWRSQEEDIDVEKAISPGVQGVQRPGDGVPRRKGWCYYLRWVLLTPIIIVSIICVGSVLYSAFFCEQGYPSPYGIIFPTMT